MQKVHCNTYPRSIFLAHKRAKTTTSWAQLALNLDKVLWLVGCYPNRQTSRDT